MTSTLPPFISERRLDLNQRAQYAGFAAGQWLEARLQLIGCAVVAGVSVVSVLEHHTRGGVSPGFAGLAISYALGITGRLSALLSSFTETEMEMVAVERCYEYINQVRKGFTKKKHFLFCTD